MDSDVQTQLLWYFTQGSLAHGAMLFAAVMATLYFLNLVKKAKFKKSLKRDLSILIISTILMSSCFYVLGRIIFYGTLAYHTIMTPVDNIDTVDIGKYYLKVISKSYESRFSSIVMMFGNIGKMGELYVSIIFSFVLGFFASVWLLWTINIIDFQIFREWIRSNLKALTTKIARNL